MSAHTQILILLILLAAIVPRTCDSYAQYKERIPNGVRVPHPCKPNYVWRGVGHESLHGGGPRNQFGRDFAANGHRWTAALCRADSDGDGRTNGQELGDPNCTWREGMVSENQLTVSHPGICDPHGSPECQARNWDFCDQSDEFECDAITQPDVMNITLRFNRTKVPAERTSYFCMVYDLDDYLEDDAEYHLIAMQPDIDNEDVMHHALLTVCFKQAENIKFSDSPVPCDMTIHPLCFNLLGIWTLGLNGQCQHKDTGFLISKNHFSKFAVQFHWNNPLLEENYWDGSALTLYLTKKKRIYNAGILIVGNTGFEIPPRQEDVFVKGSCSSRCTHMFVEQPIYFVNILNHMHYLGTGAYSEHRRNNTLLSRLGDEPEFNYDSPKLHQFTPHIEFLPGDELTMHCHFSSMDSQKYTYYGDGTMDEMCFGFIMFYPAEAVNEKTCNAYRSLDKCARKASVITDGCDYGLYRQNNNAMLLELMGPVIKECRATYCRPECKRAAADVRKHPCMRGDMGHVMRIALARVSEGTYMNMLAKLSSCDVEETCSNPAPRFQSSTQINERCDAERFLNLSSGELDRVLGPVLNSRYACLRADCQNNCADLISAAKEHPCLHHEAGEMMDLQVALMSKGKYRNLYTNLHKCDVELLCAGGMKTTTQPVVTGKAPSVTMHISISMLTGIVIVAMISEIWRSLQVI